MLGPLEVERDGAPVELAGQRQRAVARLLLLLNANHVVPTERLVDELWGESRRRRPRRRCTTRSPSCGRRSGARRSRRGRRDTAPRRRSRALDLARSSALLARRARRAAAEERVQLLREALAEWRGPPLAELAYESFAQGEIRRLEELRARRVEDRLDAELELGRHGAARGGARGARRGSTRTASGCAAS